MGLFELSKEFPVAVQELEPVATSVMDHFRAQGYEVTGERTILQGWDISLHKGNVFKAILGLKSALKIQIETTGATTQVNVRVGIFGQQAVPTAISMLVFWPVLVTQVWGLVVQANLDKEAMNVVEQALTARAAQISSGASDVAPSHFCHACGAALEPNASFCGTCGVHI